MLDITMHKQTQIIYVSEWNEMYNRGSRQHFEYLSMLLNSRMITVILLAFEKSLKIEHNLGGKGGLKGDYENLK